MRSARDLGSLGLVGAVLLLGVAACGDPGPETATTGIVSTGCSVPPDGGTDLAPPDAAPVPRPEPDASLASGPETNPAAPDTNPVPSAAPASAVFLTQEQMRNIGSGNREVDPKTVHLFVGNRPRSCGNPFMSGVPHCGSWMFGFRLTPEMQKAGTTWHVEDPALDFYYSQSGPDRGNGDCWGAAGNGFRFGDVTVVEVTERFIVVRLDDVRTLDWDGSGTYTVERCP
jgi:hypothetical protein